MSYKVTLVGLQAHEQTPAIAVYAVNARGQATKKIAVVTNGELNLPSDRNAVVAFGPDVADASTLDPKTLVTLRLADQLPIWEQKNEITLPGNWWRGWIGLQVCLSGSVSQCYPRFIGIDALRAIALGQQDIILPETCIPICNAVVEIWQNTTCCWPFLITELPPLIKKLSAFLATNPIMFPPPPSPDPVTASQLSLVNAALGAGKVANNFLPDPTLAQHLQALQSLQGQDAVTYVETYPSLWPFICNSSSYSLLGETTLNPNGTFSYCYHYYPLFILNCRHSYFYKVKQLIGGTFTYIYDGSAANQYFSADDDAALYTQGGTTCYQPPSLPGKDYIALQAIGGTNTYSLNSNWAGAVGGPGGTLIDQTQTGDTTLTALPIDAGLTVSNGSPWATTLPLLLNYDPELQNAAVVPYYYQFSVVQSGPNGAPLPAAAPITLLTPISWAYFDTSTPQITIASQSLGPVTVNGNPGLYQIPYFGIGNPDWLGNQYHQTLDTTTLLNVLANSPGTGNGQYLLTLEVFDINGNRLVPADATAPLATDTVGTFNYVRLLQDGTDTANVPFNALTHLLWVDNRPVVAAIEYFMNSNGTQVCQFYQESSATPFYVGFEAYHTVMCDNSPSPIPANTFMSGFSLTYQEGLAGNSGTLASGGDTNWANACAVSVANAISTATPPAATPPFNVPTTTFGDMLAPETACSFAISLNVTSKHTNGSGPIYAYWASQIAAVALADVAFCDVIQRKHALQAAE